jgi:hypothetical protein
MAGAKNVLGTDLEPCSFDPLTGFYRDGCCNTGADDLGLHIVCIRATAEFLRLFPRARQRPEHTPPRNGVCRAYGREISGASAPCAGRKPWMRAWRRPSYWKPPTSPRWSSSTSPISGTTPRTQALADRRTSTRPPRVPTRWSCRVHGGRRWTAPRLPEKKFVTFRVRRRLYSMDNAVPPDSRRTA